MKRSDAVLMLTNILMKRLNERDHIGHVADRVLMDIETVLGMDPPVYVDKELGAKDLRHELQAWEPENG